MLTAAMTAAALAGCQKQAAAPVETTKADETQTEKMCIRDSSYHYPRQSYEYCKRIVKANITLIDNYFAQLKNISGIVAGDADIIQAVSYRNKTEDIDYSIELYNQRRVASKIKQLDVLSDITNAVIIGRDLSLIHI